MSWSTKPTVLGREITGDFSKEIRKVSLRVLRGLTIASPVDTGRFVNNWVVGIGSKDSTTIEQVDKSGREAVARGETVIRGHVGFRDIWISNNLPYADRLNNGHSGQAPAGFVEAVLAREADR